MHAGSRAGYSITELMVGLVISAIVAFVFARFMMSSNSHQQGLLWKTDLNSVAQNLARSIDCSRTVPSTGCAANPDIYLTSDAANAPSYPNAGGLGSPVGQLKNDVTGNWYLVATCANQSLNIRYSRKNQQGLATPGNVKDPETGQVYTWKNLFPSSSPCQSVAAPAASTAPVVQSALLQTYAASLGAPGTAISGIQCTGEQNSLDVSGPCNAYLGRAVVTAQGNLAMVSLQANLMVQGNSHWTGLHLLVTDASTGAQVYNTVVNQMQGILNTQALSSTTYTETPISTTPGDLYYYDLYLNSGDSNSSLVPASELQSPVGFFLRDYGPSNGST